MHAEWLLKGKKGNYELVRKINRFLRGGDIDRIAEDFAKYMALENLRSLKRILDRYPRDVRGMLYVIVLRALKEKKKYANIAVRTINDILKDKKAWGAMPILLKSDIKEVDEILKFAGEELWKDIKKRVKADKDTLFRFYKEFEFFGYKNEFPYFAKLLDELL